MKPQCLFLAGIAYLLALVIADIPMGGYNIQNTRMSPDATISASNINNIALKWQVNVDRGVSATGTTATVNGKRLVFFPDWAGNVYAVNLATGDVVWKVSVTWYTGSYSSISRTSIAIYDGKLILGDQAACNLLALDASNGNLIWVKSLDDHPMCFITQSPTIGSDGTIYVGLASSEESWNRLNVNYQCCSFRGSMVAVTISGDVKWKFYTVPEGFSGGGVWGSSASLDVTRNAVYFASGNNYQVSSDALTCLGDATISDKSTCFPATNMINSIIAVTMDTGTLIWSKSFGGIDIWTQACVDNGNIGCGQDIDFAQGPMLSTIGSQDVIIAGQKSGWVWCVNRDTGATIWSQPVTPQGVVGMRWGSTTDGTRVYVASANDGSTVLWVNGQSCNTGVWTALNIQNGNIVWQVCDPSGGQARGALSVNAAGVLFTGSTSGTIFAFDAATGGQLWTKQLDNTVISGPSLTDGLLLWGQGFRETYGTVYQAYSVPGSTPEPNVGSGSNLFPSPGSNVTQLPTSSVVDKSSPSSSSTVYISLFQVVISLLLSLY
jgi:polyvinyl alcohol dehydrogenase (cytochrome)